MIYGITSQTTITPAPVEFELLALKVPTNEEWEIVSFSCVQSFFQMARIIMFYNQQPVMEFMQRRTSPHVIINQRIPGGTTIILREFILSPINDTVFLNLIINRIGKG